MMHTHIASVISFYYAVTLRNVTSKVVLYSITSVGLEANRGSLAVSPQLT